MDNNKYHKHDPANPGYTPLRNPWFEHVRQYKRLHPDVDYKTCLTEAKKTYKKIPGGRDTRKTKPYRKKGRRGVKQFVIESGEQEGEGLGDFALERMPQAVRRLLSESCDSPIRKVVICRRPLQKVITAALKLFTRGKSAKRLRELFYDDLYHLYSIVYTNKGRFLMEKNEIVNLSSTTIPEMTDDTDCMTISMDSLPAYTLNDLFDIVQDDAKKRDVPLFRYSAAKYNCQDFMIRVYQPLKLSTAQKKFILQDVGDLIPGFLKKVANAATDIVGFIKLITSK